MQVAEAVTVFVCGLHKQNVNILELQLLLLFD